MKQKIIFADCFSTVICRDSSAREILYKWCRELGEKYLIDPVVLYKIHSKIQFSLAIKNRKTTKEYEFKFDDVVSLMYDILKKNISDLVRDSFFADALDLYIKVEKNSHYVDENFIARLKAYKESGAKIYILSEFYCGKGVLEQFLDNLKILDLFEDIFVSCDYMMSKRTGRLYKNAIKIIGANKKDIVMFGDNPISDIFMARLCGIKAVKVATKPRKSSKELKKTLKNGDQYLTLKQTFKKYGKEYNFSNYAYPLFLFIKRLYAKLEQRQVKNVFFLSREGWYLKKLFDEYCAVSKSATWKVKTHYLQVSRNSVYRVNLKPLGQQDFSYITKKSWYMSIFRLLNSLDFNEMEVKQVADAMNINIKKSYFKFDKSKCFLDLLNCDIFKKIYDQKRENQADAFENYLASFGVDFAKEGLHIVDVGWRGTMQNLLNKYFDGRIRIYGYYIALMTTAICRDNKYIFASDDQDAKIAFLHDGTKQSILGNKMYNKLTLLDYEQLCRADHNRVIGYKNNNGVPEILYEDVLNEKEIHNNIVQPIQSQIDNKFATLCACDTKHLSMIEPCALKMYYKMMRHLSNKDLKWLFACQNAAYDSFVYIGYTGRFNNVFETVVYRILYFWLSIKNFFIVKKLNKKFFKSILKRKSKQKSINNKKGQVFWLK